MCNVNQMTQCAIWGTDSTPISRKIKFEHYEPITIENIDTEILKLLMKAGLKTNENLKTTDKLSVYGSDYLINLFIAVDTGIYSISCLPTFGKIRIYISRTTMFIYYTKSVKLNILKNL